MPRKRPLLEGEPDLPTLLAAVRAANGWDQAQLAAELDVDQGTVSKWIRAESQPSRKPTDNWERIAAVALIDVSDVGAVIGRTNFVKQKTRRELERENAELRRRLGDLET